MSMVDLSSSYMGLSLKNPIIVSSSGLTDSAEKIKNLEQNNAGAVVLKSLFEEEIIRQTDQMLQQAKEDEMIYTQLSETLDYLDVHMKEESLEKYIQLIKSAKKEVMIPVIASINCVTPGEWIPFAREIENAGADGLELNIAVLPTDHTKSAEEIQQLHFNIIEKVKKDIKIPVAVKISPYFANLGQFLYKLGSTEVDALVLFNRFYQPDFDLKRMTVKPANHFSHPSEYNYSLRWIALASQDLDCDLAASSGIHNGQTILKEILAGAQAVEIASVIYQHGPQVILELIEEMENWMRENNYMYLNQLKGKLASKKVSNPAVFERIQFMRYFGGIGQEPQQ